MLQYKWFRSIFLMMIFVGVPLKSVILSTDRFESILSYIHKDVLIITDINDTILQGGRLLEGNVPDIIKNLQQKKIPIIALTRVSSRKKDSYIAHLSSVGIDFSIYSFTNKKIIFQFQKRVVYDNGILFAGSYAKGEVLRQFLAQVRAPIKRIIFIDNDRENICSVQKAADALALDFVGLHYMRSSALNMQ